MRGPMDTNSVRQTIAVIRSVLLKVYLNEWKAGSEEYCQARTYIEAALVDILRVATRADIRIDGFYVRVRIHGIYAVSKYGVSAALTNWRTTAEKRLEQSL